MLGDGTERCAKGESEEHVGDGRHASLAEVGGADAVTEPIERLRPPSEEKAERPGDDSGDERGDRKLDG